MKHLLIVAAVTVALLPAPASAHRSWCHAKHTCPSDTGSYSVEPPAALGSSRPAAYRTTLGSVYASRGYTTVSLIGTSESADLSGWTLRHRSTRKSVRLPTGFTLESYSIRSVTTGPKASPLLPGDLVLTNEQAWPFTGGTIELVDPQGEVTDEQSY